MSEDEIQGPTGNQYNNVAGSYQSLVPGATAGVNGLSQNTASGVGSLTALLNNNPYQQGAQTGAVQGSQYGTGTLTPQQQTAAGQNFATGSAAGSYVPQALATGFDPQNQLYQQQFQQNQDQTNAVNSMNGVAGSPYGAGVANQSNLNFNTAWGANQQARQQAAAGTANTLAGTQGTSDTTVSNLGTAGLNTQIGASAAPSSTFTSNLNSLLQSLGVGASDVSTASSATTNVMDSLLQFLGYGTNASAQQAQQQNQTAAGIGSGLAGLAGLNTGGGGTLIGDILA